MTFNITGDNGIDNALNNILTPPKPMTEKEKILREFNRNCNVITCLLEDIKSAVEKRKGLKPEKIDWSKVSDTDHVVDQLNEIIRFLNNTEAE